MYKFKLKMFKLIFDLETTGLPQTISFGRYYSYTDLNRYIPSRILSICIHLYYNDILINRFYSLIKPDNFEVKGTEIHGITQEKAESQGIPFLELIPIIEGLFKKSGLVIGHNVNFDRYILCSELYRYNYSEIASYIFNKSYYCTMTQSKSLLSLEKFPKLTELYHKLFQELMKGAHNAECDVEATGKCYFSLQNLGTTTL